MSKVVRSSCESEVQIWETEEDDMTEGDLGYGLGRRPGGIYDVEVSHLFTSRKRSARKILSPPPSPRKGEESSGAIFQYSKHKSLQDAYPQGPRIPSYRRQCSTDSNSELSNVELRQRLHETLEEVEVLKTELEACQRQLEGKEEALKILQSLAVLGKATGHTQAVLQKTVEQKRSLEKEINALQWEIEFDQNRFKNIEESWTQKCDRLNCENAVLKETLKLKTEEIKMLKSENAILNQQYLETLAMLDIKQQKMAQENMCHSKSSCFTEVSALELAVLGACLCHGPGGSPCSCAKMAASARKLLLQLKQELELLQKSKEEAYIMADAFRIAFEQQLMRKNDQALRLTQMDKMCKKATKQINWKHLKEDGFLSQRSKKTLGQKLLGMLPSENSSKKTEDQDNPQEVFKMLIDLLNDKEEALAHQRKVSYMLARALEDKDTASKQNKEKNAMKETFPFKKPWHKTSELSAVHDPICSNVQMFNSMGCICSAQHPQTDQNYTRTLKKSRSLPSDIIF
ncbi:coiled-coil domain-containing protein 125 isoform X1 [Trichechus manatus latirostris]|uniref:Coiled-coil domain-containing protein 125 isoform X1 n=1 Tax=Trichechus manatus latirostris TaxID=127582 RepID=A0A2Y9FVZ3_TRIMA|nr:coiled-coil domain-containing protein 125 isoform X1 [Trichechus manatus latirostris]